MRTTEDLFFHQNVTNQNNFTIKSHILNSMKEEKCNVNIYQIQIFTATFHQESPEHQLQSSWVITPLNMAVVTLNTFTRKTHSHWNSFH